MINPEKKTISVVGFGYVGSTLTNMLLSGVKNVHLNILDPVALRNGNQLDLFHAATVMKTSISFNDNHLFVKSDIILYSAGYSNTHGEDRSSVLNKNIALAQTIFEKIDFSNNPIIVVISNPVDSLSFYIQHFVGNKARVIGTGTSLDTFRLKHLLSEEFQIASNKITTDVIGEHGNNMIPLFSNTTLNGIAIKEMTSSEHLKEIETKLKELAFEIRETEPATMYGIAATSFYLVQQLLSNNEIEIDLSIPVPEFLDYNFKGYLSWKCRFSRGNINPIALKLDKEEEKKLEKTIDVLKLQQSSYSLF